LTLPLVINPNDPGHLGDHEEIHGLLANAQSPFDNVALDGADLFANRPAAGVQGRYFYATDTGVIYRDSGSAWQPWSGFISDLIVNLLQASPTVAGLLLPSTRVQKSGGQTISNGIGLSTVVTFAVETGDNNWDNDSFHSVSSNTGRLVAPRNGYYLIGANIWWESNATGLRRSTLNKNGTTSLASDSRPAVSGDNTFQSVVTPMILDAAEWAEVRVAQSSGGNLDVQTVSSFWMMLIGTR